MGTSWERGSLSKHRRRIDMAKSGRLSINGLCYWCVKARQAMERLLAFLRIIQLHRLENQTGGQKTWVPVPGEKLWESHCSPGSLGIRGYWKRFMVFKSGWHVLQNHPLPQSPISTTVSYPFPDATKMVEIILVFNFRTVSKVTGNDECENMFKYLSIILVLRSDDRNDTAKEQDSCREI